MPSSLERPASRTASRRADNLAQEHFRVAARIVSYMRETRPDLGLSTLHEAAFGALSEAAHSYDGTREEPFPLFAMRLIWLAIFDLVRDADGEVLSDAECGRLVTNSLVDRGKDLLRRDAVSLGLEVATTAIESEPRRETAAAQTNDPVLERVSECYTAVELARLALDAANHDLDESVAEARASGTSWTRLAKTLGKSTSQVQKRFDPVSKQKHLDYMRKYRKGDAAE